MVAQPAIEAVGLTKDYPGTRALDGVSLAFAAGSVHALIGKNGAGKSTLVRVLAGVEQPSAGRLLAGGLEARFASPRDALRAGIVTVYQELSLVPSQSVAENLMLGHLPVRRAAGLVPFVHWGELRRRAQEMAESLRIELDMARPASDLSVAQQQLVEIARAAAMNPKVLILDEPTSALSRGDTECLFGVIRQLRSRGVAIIYISHRLQELAEIADEVTVLRDGRLIGMVPIADATPGTVAEMMFGETVQKHRPTPPPVRNETVLSVNGLTRARGPQAVSFSLNRGEVLGIAGLLGSGRTELLRCLMGADTPDSGTITLNGRTVTRPTPALMKNLGMGLTPENRKEAGLVQMLSIRENACLASMDRIASHGFLTRARERAVAEATVRALQVRTGDLEQPVSSLSGGNQQKVVVGNWLNTHPSVMCFDEPTRGIDVQAKQQVFQIIRELCVRGVACIFVSSELEEILEVAHRVLVIKDGRVTHELDTQHLELPRLFELCL
jgi:ABC-type sugar transport system ATPase subunit